MTDQTDSTAPIDRGDLPLPDFDHLPVEALQHRIRSLDAEALNQLLGYETAHANRAHVVTILEQRLRQLAEGSVPSEGDPTAVAPEKAPPPSAGSEVSPTTGGPPINPPSQGVPTNPSQPRPST